MRAHSVPEHDHLAVDRIAPRVSRGAPSGCAEMARALTVVTTIGRYPRCSLRAASDLVARLNGIAAVIAAIEMTTTEAANIIIGSSAETPKTTLLSQCDAEKPATTPKAITNMMSFEACMPAQEKIVDRRAPSAMRIAISSSLAVTQ